MANVEPQRIYQEVQSHYGTIARSEPSHASSAIAEAFGYSAEDLKQGPPGSNLGLSCGNPLAIASLREGEVLVDLGCGAGFDIFAASKQVGSSGKAIGIDMNEDMLARARKNQALTPGSTNVSFVRANITKLPLADASVDCVISNCVINLVPVQDKPKVFQEIGRVLKPGGRLAVSDILARTDLPGKVRDEMSLYVGCISGASTPSCYTEWMEKSGFEDITIVDAQSNLNVYHENTILLPCGNASTSCCGSISESQAENESSLTTSVLDFNQWAGSYKIYAVKS